MVQDGQYLAVFNSAHRIMKAEDLLKSKGIKVLLIPAPRAMQTDCGLAIRFDKDQHNEIMAALKAENLLPAFISRMENGVYITQKELHHEDH